MDREYDQILNVLIRSLDGALPASEEAQLEEALRTSERLRLEKARLLDLRAELKDWSVPEDPDFAARVLSQIGKQAEEDLSGVIIRLFPRVAAACVMVLAVALGTIYLTDGSLMLDTIIGVNEVVLEEAVMLVDSGF